MQLARSWSLLAAGALLVSAPAQSRAQAPTVEGASVAMRVTPLPVLDDYGEVIPEDLIRATTRGKGKRAVIFPLLGALAGTLIFTKLTDPPFACDPYDPCTPREEYYRDGGPVTGLIVGTLIGFALPDGSVDRPTAVRLLRERRRAEREGRTVP